MGAPNDVVIAGPKAFALALFAPLTERTGARPRIAPEPAQALALCAGSPGILVVEYGAPWLAILQQLRQQAPALRIVAALPRGEEGAALTLAPLGVEAVPWDGQPAQVVGVVTRLLGAAGPVAVAAPMPAARPAPRLATTPSAGTPAQAAPKLAVAAPVRPAAPPAPRPPVVPPAVAPAPPPASPPLAAPPLAPLPDDLFSGFEDAPAAPVAAPAHEQSPILTPPPYLGPSGGAPSARPTTDWPANGPSESEAESALVLYTRGKLRADAPLAAITRQVVASMSELERQVIAGAAQPFDTQPIYRAAVLRLRVAVALATVPAPPARVDDAAVQRLLSELDALLALVNPLAQQVPPEHHVALEGVRNALVREAVDFSEATHRVTAGGPPPPEASARPAPRAAAPGSRVLSVHAGEEEEAPEERRRRGPLLVLVLALLAGGGFHVQRLMTAVPPPPVKTLEGAPAGTRLLTNENGTFLATQAGAKVDPAELERFKESEKKKGNVVREIVPGRWKIEAATPGGQGAKP